MRFYSDIPSGTSFGETLSMVDAIHRWLGHSQIEVDAVMQREINRAHEGITMRTKIEAVEFIGGGSPGCWPAVKTDRAALRPSLLSESGDRYELVGVDQDGVAIYVAVESAA